MSDEKNSTEATPVEVECPQCKHKFWHKLGHALKEAGIAAVETPIEIIAEGSNFGGAGD